MTRMRKFVTWFAMANVVLLFLALAGVRWACAAWFFSYPFAFGLTIWAQLSRKKREEQVHDSLFGRKT